MVRRIAQFRSTALYGTANYEGLHKLNAGDDRVYGSGGGRLVAHHKLNGCALSQGVINRVLAPTSN